MQISLFIVSSSWKRTWRSSSLTPCAVQKSLYHSGQISVQVFFILEGTDSKKLTNKTPLATGPQCFQWKPLLPPQKNPSLSSLCDQVGFRYSVSLPSEEHGAIDISMSYLYFDKLYAGNATSLNSLFLPISHCDFKGILF